MARVSAQAAIDQLVLGFDLAINQLPLALELLARVSYGVETKGSPTSAKSYTRTLTEISEILKSKIKEW